MKLKESHYYGHDGTRMLLRAWSPDVEAKAVIVGIHGLGSHSGLLSFLGESFSSRGFYFYAPDMRGFGTFPGKKGHVENFDEYIEDMHNLVRQVKDNVGEKTVFLFGHSLGGLHVIRYVITHLDSVAGAIIPCPAVSERLKVSGAARTLVSFLSKLNLKIYVGNGLDHDLISRNKEVVERNREDPLRFDKVTPRLAVEGLSARAEAFENAAEKITLPIFVPQSGDDEILIPEVNKEFFDRIASEDKTWKLYDGLYHEPFEEPGGEQVLEDIFAWIEERI